MGHSRKRARLVEDAIETPSIKPSVDNILSIINEKENKLQELYSTSVEAKIWKVASGQLFKPTPPTFIPEYTEPGGFEYVYRDLSFWTSGFFPGSLYLLLERQRKYPHVLHSLTTNGQSLHQLQLEFACKWWTENLHQNAILEGTHDLGFMITPWAKLAWILNRDFRAFETLKTTAKTLSARFSPAVGALRSWDTCKTKAYSFQDPAKDFLMIIDNMMNLDLLFYVAAQTGNKEMYNIALAHARTTQRSHIRSDSSTIHLVVFDPLTGDVKSNLTNQGHSPSSCWARGQAWAIAGFAETYHWTHDKSFLSTSRNCADYFIARLPPSSIPPWDFDAVEREPKKQHPSDTSAAMIAAYGMLLLHEALTALGEESGYLAEALRITAAVCESHINPHAKFTVQKETIKTVEHGAMEYEAQLGVDVGEVEAILSGATINNYEFAPRRWANHSLVYADYFFLLVGNKLLEMGLGPFIAEGTDQLKNNGNGIVNGKA